MANPRPQPDGSEDVESTSTGGVSDGSVPAGSASPQAGESTSELPSSELPSSELPSSGLSERERTGDQEESAGEGRGEQPKWGTLLLCWMALVVACQGVIWTTGVPDYDLAVAIEEGAARVEEQARGEEEPDELRENIQLQRDSRTFWTVICVLRDFVVLPCSLALRAWLVAVTFSALAAMTGRQVRFPVAMAHCVAWQGIWVVGIALEAVLMVALRESHVDTSLMILMPPAQWTARQYAMLQQIDLFALLGWLGLAWGACVRKQANLVVALIACLVLASIEISMASSGSLLINLGIRASLMPQ